MSHRPPRRWSGCSDASAAVPERRPLYDDVGVTDSALDVDEAVFDAVERIPPGRVSTYGAIGRLIGIGPRRVARALSSGGGAVPWYRVVRADGSAAEPVRVQQLELLAAEGVPMRNGRVDVSAVGWPD